ncbi:hypothetical protein BN946_scf184970.g100 [Trametes cinnabarina]|uniref:Uncharacterized protein n=1 Tax=Pycnoporus cinnabarinus TaxID=5643 RepID=A0A060SIJ3_PYCCI|nr:hypothetical protein BN946_scf184970.g100 [Trametes cinnabarina]
MKELAYLERFGQPVLPFRRVGREPYGVATTSERRHPQIAPSLAPKDPSLKQFRVRHPVLNSSNIIVSKSSDGDWQVVGVLDRQHAAILPMSLLAGIPKPMQNYGDMLSECMVPPSPPSNLADMDDNARSTAEELYRRRLVQQHYLKSTEPYKRRHFSALTNPLASSAAASSTTPASRAKERRWSRKPRDGGLGPPHGRSHTVPDRVRRAGRARDEASGKGTAPCGRVAEAL